MDDIVALWILGVERERRGEDRAAGRLVAPGADGGAEVFPEPAALRVLVRRERRVGRRGRVGCQSQRGKKFEERTLDCENETAKLL